MRYKNHILVILSLTIVVILAQCRKDDKKPNENDPALIADGKIFLGSTHLAMKISGVDFCISIRLSPVLQMVDSGLA
jgi:hypothetical protein